MSLGSVWTEDISYPISFKFCPLSPAWTKLVPKDTFEKVCWSFCYSFFSMFTNLFLPQQINLNKQSIVLHSVFNRGDDWSVKAVYLQWTSSNAVNITCLHCVLSWQRCCEPFVTIFLYCAESWQKKTEGERDWFLKNEWVSDESKRVGKRTVRPDLDEGSFRTLSVD